MCTSGKCISMLCERALQCQQLLDEGVFEDLDQEDEPHCPLVFDGWSCINATKANTTAIVSCPKLENYNYNPDCKCWSWSDQDFDTL